MSEAAPFPAAPAVAASAAAAPSITPPRIKSVTLCDFRAFAGPKPVTFHLDGKNLLIYGENGAGKSSVFHALDEFFAIPSRSTNAETRRLRLLSLANRFTQKIRCKVIGVFQDEDGVQQAVGSEIVIRECFARAALDAGALELVSRDNAAVVEIAFTDGASARWDKASHPIDTATGGQGVVVNAAYRKAILDYRSLLETNFRHGSSAINLFDVCINVLLRDYLVQHDGREWRLFDLWMELIHILDLAARGRTRMGSTDKKKVLALLPSINDGIRGALAAVLPMIKPLLVDLGWDDVEVTALDFSGVTYRNQASIAPLMRIETKEIGVSLTFRGQPIERPQNFLNEARLSALALAIYFAGRQLCATTTQVDAPRLIVLDDVLIGLDQSNRMPVLRMLDQHFDGWQIVLLTHDRVWYEMARFHLADRDDWAAADMFERKQPDGTPMPIAGVVTPFVRPASIDAIAANIGTAREFYGMNEYAAAAVHARVAFELSLKKLCDRKSIPVRFKDDPRGLSTEDLLAAITEWLGNPKQQQIKPHVEMAIRDVRMARRVVLNQFSHSTPVNLAGTEVKSAIDAVEALQRAFKDHIPTK